MYTENECGNVNNIHVITSSFTTLSFTWKYKCYLIKMNKSSNCINLP